ncbi:hypothetical protein ACQP10_38495 (plasmid) [Streptosporangium sandarakinum]|uniref:hypothetical protein n=1 Tax=Streptosporangium TaxID=2000 RepID=UPI0031F7A5C6
MDDDIKAALDALSRQYDHAAELIENMSDQDAALKAATELTEVLRLATISAGQLRADRVYKLWQSRHLSLSKLADVVGVSKTRAAEMINTAKKSQEDSK